MVPFNIRIKANSNGDKWTRYTEINVYGTQYRLHNTKTLTVDGVQKELPFEDAVEGSKVFWNGNMMEFYMNFGLLVKWDGANLFVNLCQRYANLICGLCGRGLQFAVDRSKPNALVIDRNNNMVGGGNVQEREANWGAAWRVPDDSADAPQQ